MKTDLFRATICGRRVGMIFNTRAVWVGVHGSNFNKRFCVNVIPCVTLWICKVGGVEP